MYINYMEKKTPFETQVGAIISLYSSGKIEKALENVDRLIKLNSNEAILSVGSISPSAISSSKSQISSQWT